MMARMYHTIWPDAATPADGDPCPSGYVHNGMPNEFGLGLTVLAERLRDESADAFSQFAARWHTGQLDVLLDDVSVVATAVRAR